MKRKSRHLYHNQAPKYCTADLNGSCVIFERGVMDRSMTQIEVLYKAVKIVRYDGSDSVIEEPVGANAKSMILQLRTGSLLPETYGELELTWYEDKDENGNPIELEEILVMCSI